MNLPAPERPPRPPRAPFWIAAAVVAGCALGIALARPVQGMLFGALLGGLLGGVLFFMGWAGMRRAMEGPPNRLLRAVFGGMLMRLMVAGAAAAVVIGFGLADAAGFVCGLFAVTFAALVIEVLSLSGHARRLSATPAREGNGVQA